MRQLNNYGSIVPLVLFILTVFGLGFMYTIFFIEVAIPELAYLIPSSDYKTYFLMLIWGIPIIIMVVGLLSLMKSGIKEGGYA